jgi:hypothetical protein
MTEKNQDQTKAKKQTQAIELEEAQLEQAQGGILDGSSNTRTGGKGVKGILDGSSNT